MFDERAYHENIKWRNDAAQKHSLVPARWEYGKISKADGERVNSFVWGQLVDKYKGILRRKKNAGEAVELTHDELFPFWGVVSAFLNEQGIEIPNDDYIYDIVAENVKELILDVNDDVSDQTSARGTGMNARPRSD